MRRPLEILVGLALGALVGIFSVQLGGCAHNKAGWIAVEAFQSTAAAVGFGLAAKGIEKHYECTKKHGLNTPGYKACIAPALKAAKTYRDYFVPAFNSAVHGGKAILKTADLAGKETTAWIEKLKPGVCALASIVEQWTHLLPEKIVKAMAFVVGLLKGVTCRP